MGHTYQSTNEKKGCEYFRPEGVHFICAKPFVPHTETFWLVLDFWCYSLQTKNKQTLNCPIGHLEAEELRVRTPKFYHMGFCSILMLCVCNSL